jgi:hypothetical protein
LGSEHPKRNLAQAFGKTYEARKQWDVWQHQDSSNYIKTMHTALTHYLHRCAFCTAIDKHNEAVQALKDCPHMHPEFGDYAGFRKSIKYAKHHGGVCFWCHVPQCNDELHATFVKGGDDACDFPDVVGPVV